MAVVAIVGCDFKPTGQPEVSRTKLSPASSAQSSQNRPQTDLTSIDLRTVASLAQDGPAIGKKTLVRIRGIVLDRSPGEFIVVRDETGMIIAKTHQTNLPRVRELVDLVGQLVVDSYSISLKDAVVAPLKTTNSLSSTIVLAPATRAALPQLTKILQVLDLPIEKAVWQYPVQLHAVVTANTKVFEFFFAQDDSAGISVKMPTIPTHINPGDAVLIEGVSQAGVFASIVLASNVTVTGKAPLPPAQPATLFQLAAGPENSQWVEVEGIVRAINYIPTRHLAALKLKDFSGNLNVIIPANAAPTNLLDALVRIRGVCYSRMDDNTHYKIPRMWASSLDEVFIKEAGVTNPLNQPTVPIASLNLYHPPKTFQHRVTVAGLVTVITGTNSLGENNFFIQDAEAGVKVITDSPQHLEPGDYIIASGYLGLGEFGWLLENPIFKIISHEQMPKPQSINITSDQSDIAPWHDRWVQVKARFLHYTKIGAVDLITLENNNRVFEVRFLQPVSDRIKNLQAGSVLQVTGIYRVLTDDARIPKSLQLVVPTEREIQVLVEPSWWTVSHALTVVGVMSVIISAAVLWLVLLSRKVQERTANLKQSERKFRSLVEQSMVGVYIVQDHRFVYVNPRMAAIFGYSPEEFKSFDHLKTIIHPGDRDMVQEQIRRRLDREIDAAHYFFRGLRKDGSVVYIEVHGSRTEVNGRPAVLGMLQDITERKLSQDKIAEQARMLNLASDAIVVCDLEGRVRYWNKNARQVYGWTAQQAIGELAWEKMRIAPAEFQEARDATLHDQQWHGEFHLHNHLGNEITLASRWTLIQDSELNPHLILTINSNITQKKKMEEQLLRNQRLDSIGVLAGGIAHDLNNVLTPILISGQLLEIDSHIPAESRELIANILTSTNRAAGLVKQILTFARGTSGRRHTVRPAHLLEELRSILGETLPKSIVLNFPQAPDIWTIIADATQMHQVLMNLCINARDAMPKGGELTVTLSCIQLDQHQAHLEGAPKSGEYVVFSITDTGVGIEPHIRERIFEPFFTTKPVGRGTGLGLSTTLGIVKSHDGFIVLDSEPGRGSCFKIHLPLHSHVAPASEPPHQSGRPLMIGNNELILVVDDEHLLRTLAQKILGISGYRVITAANGKEALDCYQQHKDEIALVVTDMMMPVMDGQALIESLIHIKPELKIIVVSGYSNKNNSMIQAFISKPYAREKLLTVIHQVLHPKKVKPPVAG